MNILLIPHTVFILISFTFLPDAYGAQQLVKILLRLTKQGTTIMCTIHQPSSQLFSMFHKVLLLAEGRISFIGSPHEAVTFFSLYVIIIHFVNSAAQQFVQ